MEVALRIGDLYARGAKRIEYGKIEPAPDVSFRNPADVYPDQKLEINRTGPKLDKPHLRFSDFREDLMFSSAFQQNVTHLSRGRVVGDPYRNMDTHDRRAQSVVDDLLGHQIAVGDNVFNKVIPASTSTAREIEVFITVRNGRETT